jgi:hypothetical protein
VKVVAVVCAIYGKETQCRMSSGWSSAIIYEVVGPKSMDILDDLTCICTNLTMKKIRIRALIRVRPPTSNKQQRQRAEAIGPKFDVKNNHVTVQAEINMVITISW